LFAGIYFISLLVVSTGALQLFNDGNDTLHIFILSQLAAFTAALQRFELW
jgi:hypothetical protein